MSIVDRNVAVTMAREDLEETPIYPLGDGYMIRSYSPGDEEAWVRIQTAAELYSTITLDLFRHEFGDDPDELAKRQFFLVDPQHEPIGTATAWFGDDHYGAQYGRVHWVAVHPKSQGLGLSKPLLSAVCIRLQELGHEETYLKTSTARIAAINLYLLFGFLPKIEGEGDAAAWNQMKSFMEGSTPRR